MAQYIDKSALVAELENLRKHYIEREDFDIGWNMALDKILSSLDTLEVKEVDLEKEIEVWEDSFKHCPASMGYKETAKHFYELGMAVSNPITAADRGMVEEIITHLKRVENDYRMNLTKEIEWLRNKVKKGE